MAHSVDTPRVTLGIATYNRDRYLARAIRSGLEQGYSSFEVLVVVDGSTNPAIEEVLASFAGEPRLRVVRHQRNLGIAEAYNTFVSEGRGELIAMIGDDDLCLPGRLERQVALFDRHPDTGVVHGDAVVIDADDNEVGVWESRDFTQIALVQLLFRRHNFLIDPTRMVNRGVYEAVGGYDNRFPLANDFDFWLRAARRFRFRHCGGGPLVAVRRHGENTSDESSGRTQEVADVEAALEAALPLYDLRELVPELDWAVLDPAHAERQALLCLADAFDQRVLPVPGLAGKLRRRAKGLRPGPVTIRRSRPACGPSRLMMTSFGFNDSGGGTTVPRLVAKELVGRGWDVTVFHAAVGPTPSGRPYETVTWEQDGVRLIGVHNRAHGLFDAGNPARELDDPHISAAFGAALDQFRPDVVHFHNLHNLGASLMDHAFARGLPAYFSTHNYWLICPAGYLMDGKGTICAGPGDGRRCGECVGNHDGAEYERRVREMRARAHRGLGRILAVSDAVRDTLLASGYSADLVDVVRQAMPHETEIWESVGRDRVPGRAGHRLTVAFLGSAYVHKGPQLLVDAAQRCETAVDVRIMGEISERFAKALRTLDKRGVVEFDGAFAPSEIGRMLAGVDAVALPSTWWDCAPLAAAECRAARVPLIVPRLGGLAEAVRHGVDGLCFDALDVDDLARQLDRLALEPGLLERLQAGIEPPKAFSAYVDELEAYYAGERPGRSCDAGGPTAVRWQGDHGLSTSLSIINDQVSGRLRSRVQRLSADGSLLDAPLPHAADVEVRHQWPPDLGAPPAGRLATIVPWEFGAVPRDWLSQIAHNVDELWVPSEYVRAMYLDAGLNPAQVVTIPNGVDLDVFTPEGDVFELPADARGIRFLFLGGIIWRKGPDVLLGAWRRAFPGRDDVTLVIKDFGADGVYRGGDRATIREYAASGQLPRIVLLDEQLATRDVAALYRACDVLVHPYRGEGFAMPVLEAMASSLPVIVTAGGPTDEFCPPEAGWRIAARRSSFADERVDTLETVGRPWVLEPDPDHLVRLLREAAADANARRVRGDVGRAAAQSLSWESVATRYQERITALRGRTPLLGSARKQEPFPLPEGAAVRLLATPAWRGDDGLAQLLGAWTSCTTPTTNACLYLLADPTVDGRPAQLEARVTAAAAAAGADIDAGADINVLMEPVRHDRDTRLHAAMNAYVALHDACDGHVRMAVEAGNQVVAADPAALRQLLTATDGAYGIAARAECPVEPI